MPDLKTEIGSFIAGEVADDAATLQRASRDASLFSLTPKLVVFPKHSGDIQRLVSFVGKHTGRLSLTVRSGGTDMTGGPLSESIVADVSRHMNHAKEIGDHAAVVEPGVLYRDFEPEALKQNLLLPSYPASKDICTLGGMVANNASGEKTLAYGSTDRYVRQLKVVLSDGNEYVVEPLPKPEVERKMQQRDFEGILYRRVFELVDRNYIRIQQAKPNVSKNSSGYALWNVWDKKTFDLTKLFVGSQGTLGVISEITFRLITPKPYSQMLVIFLKDIARLADLVQRVLAYSPESFESYDDHTFKIAVRYFPDMLKQMKVKNMAALVWQLLPEFWMLATGGVPKLILLAEFAGHDQQEVRQRALAAQASLRSFNINTRLPKNHLEARKYWTIRRESFNLLRHHVHRKRTAPFIDDIVVRPQQLPEFLPKLNDIMDDYNITYTIAGHVGDANFHIIPLINMADPKSKVIISELEDKVYNLVFTFGGSMSGEHNDGLIRSHYLEKMYGKEVYQLFKQVKGIFDPHNIFNPGKKIGADWEYARKHMVQQ